MRQTNRLIDQLTNGPMDRHELLQMWEDAHEKNFVLFYLLTTVLPHSHSCSNAHRLNMTPKHYQSTLNYQGNVLSLEECPYYKLSEQSPTKLTSVQKPWIRFQYANTYKCGERVNFKNVSNSSTPSQVLQAEVEYAKSAIKKTPHNESPWNYLRGILMQQLDQSESPMFKYPGEAPQSTIHNVFCCLEIRKDLGVRRPAYTDR